ncbi:hypothetical protein [Parahaliea mediterranea]|uniref:hypothetical protein n=1 Tax=Parahaliea mediterranea TaxID=651086 RepID=UPI000E2F6EBB|nr:hypothetical protein [Parahaliea mediterranea]
MITPFGTTLTTTTAAITATLLAAALTHVAVRYCQGMARGLALGLAGAGFAVACWFGAYTLGGFWASFYTLLSLYFLACIAAPWVDLLARRYRAR